MKNVVLIAVGALVLVGVNAGVTAALSAPATVSPAVVHAYYNNNSHALYFSSDATHPAGTTAISWLKNGTAGPRGIDAIAENATNTAGVASVVVDCPADHPYLLGGGGGGTYPERLVYDGPAHMGHGWRVEVHAASYPAETITVQAFCAR